MTEQNFIYECSRTNATHKVSNSEWINEWNEGIKLEKGDTVRLLGSFISESGSGQETSHAIINNLSNAVSVSSDTTMGASHYLRPVLVTGTTTITLPAVAIGISLHIINNFVSIINI